VRIITFEDKDALALLDELELASFRADPSQMLTGSREVITVADMHRRFHYIVTLWLQKQGASCVPGR
jgi:hypothetical protein